MFSAFIRYNLCTVYFAFLLYILNSEYNVTFCWKLTRVQHDRTTCSTDGVPNMRKVNCFIRESCRVRLAKKRQEEASVHFLRLDDNVN